MIQWHKLSKSCSTRISPEKLCFSGNYTQHYHMFDITRPLVKEKYNMSHDALMKANKKKLSMQPESKYNNDPIYEDPRDVIAMKPRPSKPPRKRNALAQNDFEQVDFKSSLKEHKRKLAKKYEDLIKTLMEKCEEYSRLISERDSYILKLKEKLKIVLEYNKQFAEENDLLKSQSQTMVQYIDDCKKTLTEEQTKNRELQEKIKHFEMPVKEVPAATTAIPLVEVCMNCSSHQILFNQAKEHNVRLQKDMQAMKDVLYRLNVQLSRYQEKLQQNCQNLLADNNTGRAFLAPDRFEECEHTISENLKNREQVTDVDNPHYGFSCKTGSINQHQLSKVADLSGLLSAQALAPLFDAYQDSLQEKDNLIMDYEKQFESVNQKSREIVAENGTLASKVASLEEELFGVRQCYKRVVVEKERADVEIATLSERAEKAERKLKEVYEMYESKMACMMRDYETVHREYYSVKCALEEGRRAARGASGDGDARERRVDACARLLDELRRQYNAEADKKSEQVSALQQRNKDLEVELSRSQAQHDVTKMLLKAAERSARLHRKAARVVRRARRKCIRRSSLPLQQALLALDKIRDEIKAVKSRAHAALGELEARVFEQQERASRALQRAEAALDHKEDVIKCLVDKIAALEDVVGSSRDDAQEKIVTSNVVKDSKIQSGRVPTSCVKFTPGPGGYFHRGKRK